MNVWLRSGFKSKDFFYFTERYYKKIIIKLMLFIICSAFFLESLPRPVLMEKININDLFNEYKSIDWIWSECCLCDAIIANSAVFFFSRVESTVKPTFTSFDRIFPFAHSNNCASTIFLKKI
jgi:hypothetical protein